MFLGILRLVAFLINQYNALKLLVDSSFLMDVLHVLIVELLNTILDPVINYRNIIIYKKSLENKFNLMILIHIVQNQDPKFVTNR